MRRTITAACAVLVLLAGCGSDPGPQLSNYTELLNIPIAGSVIPQLGQVATNGTATAVLLGSYNSTTTTYSFRLQVLTGGQVIHDQPLASPLPGSFPSQLVASGDGWILGWSTSTVVPYPNRNEVVLTLVRLHLDGSIDSAWGTGGVVELDRAPGFVIGNANIGENTGIRLMDARTAPDGTVTVLSGRSLFKAGTNLLVSRLTGAGAVDSSFNAGTPVTVGNSFASSSAAYDSALSVAGDGAATIGWLTSTGHFRVARLTPSGTADLAYGTAGVADVATAAAGGALPDSRPLGCVLGDGGFVGIFASKEVYRVRADGTVPPGGPTPLLPSPPAGAAGAPFAMVPSNSGGCILASLTTTPDAISYSRFGDDGLQQPTAGFFDRQSDRFAPVDMADSGSGQLMILGYVSSPPSVTPTAIVLRSIPI